MSAAVGLETAGRAVVGRDVRAVLAVTSAGLLLAALAGAGYTARPVVLLAVVGAAAVTAAFPASPAPAGLCVVAVFLLLSGDAGFTAWLVVAASLLHTVHVLAGLAEVIPARARAEVGALVPTVRRWLHTQLLTMPVLIVLVAVLS
ncbi:MAG TPA: hypothetical protein VFR23_10115 [Jiangellaceae bacterium]|nr:hypothetical protein [Jiangellaceae bacterium]